MYKPELYDVFTPSSFRGDLEWYRAKAREGGGPVLELGAGTGRITLGMAGDGTTVRALDADPAMLDRLRQKLALQTPEVQTRVAAVVGDMRTFTLAERFPLLIPPSVHIAGGFDGRPFERDTDELVIEAGSG